jgi:hypothetical protein
MTERRYTDDEVASIFERATESQHTGRRQLRSGEGMTLAELQEIGREVGIPAELVAQAARSVDQPVDNPKRTFLGFPIGVGKTVDLGRRISEEEWEQLVVDLRQTFDARGTVRSDGSFRQWTNGNLQALLEPTETGHRIRLRTVRGQARVFLGGGLGLLGMAAAMLVAFALTGRLGEAGVLSGPAILSVAGIGMFLTGAVQLPGWAKLRQRQMEAVAARLALAPKSDTPDRPPVGPGDEPPADFS